MHAIGFFLDNDTGHQIYWTIYNNIYEILSDSEGKHYIDIYIVQSPYLPRIDLMIVVIEKKSTKIDPMMILALKNVAQEQPINILP